MLLWKKGRIKMCYINKQNRHDGLNHHINEKPRQLVLLTFCKAFNVKTFKVIVLKNAVEIHITHTKGSENL